MSVGSYKEWIKGICVDKGRENSTSAETPPLFSVSGIKKNLTVSVLLFGVGILNRYENIFVNYSFTNHNNSVSK